MCKNFYIFHVGILLTCTALGIHRCDAAGNYERLGGQSPMQSCTRRIVYWEQSIQRVQNLILLVDLRTEENCQSHYIKLIIEIGIVFSIVTNAMQKFHYGN